MRNLLFQGLIRSPLTEPTLDSADIEPVELTGGVEQAVRARLGRSLAIRHVDAGYDIAESVADERGVRVPMREGDPA